MTGAWTTVLTVVFAATGLYGVWRLSTRRWQGIETVVDLSHVLMSPAMLVMLWWPMAATWQWAQIAVFAGLAVVFFYHLSGSETVPERAGAMAHAWMNLGMVWMLAAMPRLMSGDAWATMLSWSAVGLLVLTAGWWLVHAARTPGHRTLCGCHGLSCAGMATMLALMTPAL
ncbi:DUF5134 domain-containing protein [Kribbella sp. NBC_00709]|uniref:DUF5134 domain-containing protein n=1 Tax=Kribbella sp. NBC_00709 TaxID=2975972 RepID=UPI002E2C1740|nr:DUF5134 domain-containing protein [Kribbella sp. NBC_00709]